MAAVAPGWPTFDGRRALAGGAALAVLGLGGTAIAIAAEPRRALLGYLAAYAAVASAAVGALILLLIGYAANARWPAALRRVHESLAIVFPALAVLFVPIALGLRELYPWADPAALPEAERHAVEAKRAWLSPGAFVLRAALYLAVFAVAAEVLRRWSRRRDAAATAAGTAAGAGGGRAAGDGDAALARERAFAAALLPPVGLAVTFAAFDWLMSLQPAWFSSMFGVYYFAGGFSAGIAALAIVAWRTRARAGGAAVITPHHFHALGRLLFAFVVFWAYTAYFQGFLIQIANRPQEIAFYLPRTEGGWGALLGAVVIARFAAPFLLLLPRRPKLRPRYVAGVAVLVLAGHALDLYWVVVPAAGAPLGLHAAYVAADLAAFVGITGACVAFAAWRQRGVPIAAVGDPYLDDGIRYASPT